MSTGGWIVMLVSVGLVTALFVGCIAKVLFSSSDEAGHVHGFERKTPDEEDPHRGH